MLRRALVVLCFGLMSLIMASCGQTYELQSITVSPSSPNLEGIGSSQALTVTAHYSNTKTSDVTARAIYQLGASSDTDNAPLASLQVNNSGILKVVNAACTWTTTLVSTTGGTNTYSYTTQPYTVTVTFDNHTTTAYVSVANAGSCYDGINFVHP